MVEGERKKHHYWRKTAPNRRRRNKKVRKVLIRLPLSIFLGPYRIICIYIIPLLIVFLVAETNTGKRNTRKSFAKVKASSETGDSSHHQKKEEEEKKQEGSEIEEEIQTPAATAAGGRGNNKKVRRMVGCELYNAELEKCIVCSYVFASH